MRDRIIKFNSFVCLCSHKSVPLSHFQGDIWDFGCRSLDVSVQCGFFALCIDRFLDYADRESSSRALFCCKSLATISGGKEKYQFDTNNPPNLFRFLFWGGDLTFDCRVRVTQKFVRNDVMHFVVFVVFLLAEIEDPISLTMESIPEPSYFIHVYYIKSSVYTKFRIKRGIVFDSFYILTC